MVDAVLLLVDAVEGPMPQTRFVTRKALALGLKPIVVVNKVDRPGARPDWVVDQTFDLFDKLGATEEQLDFPVVYASALNGWATLDDGRRRHRHAPLFEADPASTCRAPKATPDGPLQLRICALDYTNYVGRIGIGRIQPRHDRSRTGRRRVIGPAESTRRTRRRISQVLTSRAWSAKRSTEAEAGDIVAVTGIEDVDIGVHDLRRRQAGRAAAARGGRADAGMNFQVNTSPLAGKEGKFVTSRQISRAPRCASCSATSRCEVEDTADADMFRVSGRGELHLTILIENMRREGYELAVSQPRVVLTKTSTASCTSRIESADGRHRRRPPGRRHGGARRRKRRAARTWSPTARAACASSTASRRAA